MSSETTVEDPLGDDDLEVPFKYAITSYGADFPVDGQVKRLKNNSIRIPDFQRGYVWNVNQASRFIESLLLGLPVPGIFLAREADSQALLVIDGQQRLKSLQYFYNGMFQQTERAFRLKGVQTAFDSLSYDELDEVDKRRLDDSILHATIVKQEDPSEDQSSIFHIFERINTGGIRLHPQEIRSSIYHGKYCSLLERLNYIEEWRDIYGAVSKTMRDQELILRFFALIYHRQNYARPMKDFLNKAIGRNRNAKDIKLNEMESAFTKCIYIAHESLGRMSFRPFKNFNAAVYDSEMVAIALNTDKMSDQEIAKYIRNFHKKYHKLIDDKLYLSYISRSTADEEIVRNRIHKATEFLK